MPAGPERKISCATTELDSASDVSFLAENRLPRPYDCDVSFEPPRSRYESATFLVGGAAFVGLVGAALLTLGPPWTYFGAVVLVAAVALFVAAVAVYFGKPKSRQGAAFMAMWKNELAEREQTRAQPGTVRQAGPVHSRATYRRRVIDAGNCQMLWI